MENKIQNNVLELEKEGIRRKDFEAMFSNDETEDREIYPMDNAAEFQRLLTETSSSSKTELLNRVNLLLKIRAKAKEKEISFAKAAKLVRQELEAVSSRNTTRIMDKVRRLEKKIRPFQLAFDNAGPVDGAIDILDISIDDLFNPNNKTYYNTFYKLIKEGLYTHDLINSSYSFVTLFGNLDEGTANDATKNIQIKNRVTKILQDCLKYKTQCVIQFPSTAKTAKGIKEELKSLDLTSADEHAKCGLLALDKVVARPAIAGLESEPLYIDAVSVILGKLLASANAAYAPSGDRQGVVASALGTLLGLTQEDVVLALRDIGTVPLLISRNKVILYSHKSMNNTTAKDKKAKTMFPVTRIQYIIDKTITSYLRRNRYEPLTFDNRKKIKEDIEDYLNDLASPENQQISGYKLLKEEQTEDLLNIDYEIYPIYPMGDFKLNVDVKKNKDAASDAKTNSNVSID